MTEASELDINKLIRNSTAEFLMFTATAGENSIEVKVEGETVWLTQKLIAELFGKGRSTITEHLKNIALFKTDCLNLILIRSWRMENWE